MHTTTVQGEAGCKLDRHENIGKGKIGLQGFKRIMQCKHFTGLRSLPIIWLVKRSSDVEVIVVVRDKRGTFVNCNHIFLTS